MAREMLDNRIGTCLAELSELEVRSPRLSRPDAPPIDAEDHAAEDYPDLTIIWTQYSRSPVSLAGKPFIDDDLYVSLFTRCLSQGCEMALNALRPNEHGEFLPRPRQTTLIKALITGFSALGFSIDKASAYLAYHRDWLLRFILVKSPDGIEPEDVIQRFDDRTKTMAHVLRALYQAADEALKDPSLDKMFTGPLAKWQLALKDLIAHITSFREDPNYCIDPYAEDPVFSPIFKVFHGLANQLGLIMPEEAFTHHILMRAIESDHL